MIIDNNTTGDECRARWTKGDEEEPGNINESHWDNYSGRILLSFITRGRQRETMNE